MISTKDLAYLEDMFNWEYTALKEIEHFKDEVNDEDIKDLFDNIANIHSEHLDKILDMIKGGCDCE